MSERGWPQAARHRRDFDDPIDTRLLGELPDTVIVIDEQGRVQWANRAAERLFNRSLEDSKGISGLDLVHPEDLELVLRSLVSVQEKEVGTAIEVRVSTSVGWRLVEVVGAPVPWFEDGAILLCVRDVTDRRRFELAHGEEARFRSIVQNSAAVTMLVSPEGRVESVSGALTRVLGHDPELVEQRPLGDLVQESDRGALESSLERARFGASAASPVTVELGLLRHSGNEPVPFELTIVNLIDDPTVGGFVISAHDITDRSIAEQRLRQALSLLTATLDSTADGILVVDGNGRITSFNRRFSEMWRIPESLLEVGDDSAVIAFVLDQMEKPEAFIAKVEELYSQPESESDDIIEFKDGRVFERHSRPQRVEGTIVGRVWSFRDVTDRKRLEQELSYQAFHDSLTGLANKALFQDRLQHAAARIERTRAHLAVLFIDLDNFKTVNDSLGHAAGDEMLRRVAEILIGCLRKVDTAARLGGDEFAVLVEDIGDHGDAITLAERILAALRHPWPSRGRRCRRPSASGSPSTRPELRATSYSGTPTSRCTRPKNEARTGSRSSSSEMHATAVARLEVEAHLNQALKGHELVVHYQPIVDLYTDDIVGFEALARWRHPTRGLLAPVSFIPFAEESDLITKIDALVIAEACSRARGWQPRPRTATWR